MSDFSFVKNPFLNQWIILSPKRATRPDQNEDKLDDCPFENVEEPLFRLNEVVVINNKYSFAPIHEVIIHSNDHEKNFDELEAHKIEDIIKTYKARFLEHMPSGHVYIFHNRGEKGGESLFHPHSQLAVIPKHINFILPPLAKEDEEVISTQLFNMFCPNASQWPDEVWIYPKEEGRMFGDIKEDEIRELALILKKLVRIMIKRHEGEFSFNFYIYHGKNWYLRLIPRLKMLGGFEVGTGIFVNSQDPKETIEFIRENFESEGEIGEEHKAGYSRTV